MLESPIKTHSIRSEESTRKMIRMMKVLSHPHRISIVEFLCSAGPKAVAEIIDELKISQSSTSQHLKLLEGQNILRSYRKDGRVMYAPVAKGLVNLLKCLDQCTNC